MKGFILKSHEAQALAAGKPVVIWRACKPQPVATPDGEVTFFDKRGSYPISDAPPPFPVDVPLFGKETWDGCEVDVIRYKAEGGPAYNDNGRGVASWKPSVQMPKWASRITLTLSDVKVRRPCDVTEEEVKAMGINSRSTGKCLLTPLQSFCEQWSTAYGDTEIAWNSYHFTALATPQPKNS